MGDLQAGKSDLTFPPRNRLGSKQSDGPPVGLVSPSTPVPGPAVGAAVREAFMLGWSISELKGRVQVAALNPSAAIADATSRAALGESGTSQAASADLVTVQTQISDAFWLGSVWRVTFNRISLLQRSLFPNSATANTRYDPGEKRPSYLYPEGPNSLDDYADLGISASDSDGEQILQAFALREATRRAINCLTLLYLMPELSLLPDILSKQQLTLVNAVLGLEAAEAPPAASENAHILSEPSETDRTKAIAQLSTQTLLFLEAWDGYLRESFFAGGLGAQDESKLVAYEAGRSISALSWGISVQQKVISSQPDQNATGAPADRLSKIWQDAFDDRFVSGLQHQVSVLGSVLDDDYYVITGRQPLPPGDVISPLDPALPSQLLRAVAHSLDFWQRSVRWLNQPRNAPTNGMTVDQWDKLRGALIEQTGVWLALVLGQEDLRAFDASGVVHRILQNVMGTIEKTIIEKGLFEVAGDVGQVVSREIEVGSKVIGQAVGRLGNVALAQVKSLSGTAFGWLLGILVLGGVSVVVLIIQSGSRLSLDLSGVLSLVMAVGTGAGVIHVRQQGQQSATAVTSESEQTQAQVDGAVDRIKSTAAAPASPAGAAAPPIPPSSGLASRVLTALGTGANGAVTTFEDVFDRGFRQVQNDLVRLGYEVGVTFPLVEYFILNDFQSVSVSYDFLTQVIWSETDQEAEVTQLASAAFGPIGLFALAAASSNERGPTNQKAADSPTGPVHTPG